MKNLNFEIFNSYFCANLNVQRCIIMIFNYISLPIFLASFAIGLFFVYVLGPEMKKIYVYPTPETVDKMLFKDKADNCFYFQEEVVDCPRDSSQISSIPIQT